MKYLKNSEYVILTANVFCVGGEPVKLNANVDELRKLVDNTQNKNVFIRFLVFCTVTKALAPGFLRYPKTTVKLYLKHLASDDKGKFPV